VSLIFLLIFGEKESITELGPVSLLHTFAHSVGRRFVEEIPFGRKLCPEAS
jgi:hypothetical protein